VEAVEVRREPDGATHPEDNDGRTQLFLAVEDGNQKTLVILLHRNNLDVNAKDKEGRSALILATQRGGSAIIKLLLKRRDLNVNAKDSHGRTSLSFAAQQGHVVIVNLLLKRIRGTTLGGPRLHSHHGLDTPQSSAFYSSMLISIQTS
jgi:ankyrin repeat protein